MNKEIFILLMLIFLSAISFSAQPQPRTLEQIRNETYETNRQIENYDRNSRNPIMLRDSLSSALKRYKIPGAEVRRYVLAAPAELAVDVVSAIGGDMLLVNDGANRISVRIIGIDAPEPGQNFFDEARKNLNAIAAGKKVVLKYSLHNLNDENKHFLARVFIDDKDIGLTSIKNGFVWYREADKFFLEKEDGEIYERAEIEAKMLKSGLWIEPKPQKPWEFREKNLKELMKAKKKAAKN